MKYCRKKTKVVNKNMNIKEDSPLEVFLRNINPDVACEIKQCWVEPENFTADSFLGKGIRSYSISFIIKCLNIFLNLGKSKVKCTFVS